MRLALSTRAVLVASVCLAAADARAIAPPNVNVAPLAVAGGDVRIVEDRWQLDCTTLAADDRCLAVLTTRTLGAGVLALDGFDAATLDGTPVELAGAESEVTVPEGPHTLVVERQLTLRNGRFNEWTMPACEVRHLVMHLGAPPGSRGLLVAFARPQDRAPGYAFELAVKGDGVHTIVPGRSEGDPPWITDGDLHRLRVDAVDDRWEGVRGLTFEDPGEVLHHGGLQLGVGGQLNHGGSFRMRLEYEVALDEWILPGLAIDADTERGFVLTPRVEFASPMILVIPSFSLGIGLPVRMRPDPDVGVRFIVGGQFGPIGLAATFDLYPLADGLLFEPAVVFRLSI